MNGFPPWTDLTLNILGVPERISILNIYETWTISLHEQKSNSETFFKPNVFEIWTSFKFEQFQNLNKNNFWTNSKFEQL
jgi:hypothetical protein